MSRFGSHFIRRMKPRDPSGWGIISNGSENRSRREVSNSAQTAIHLSVVAFSFARTSGRQVLGVIRFAHETLYPAIDLAMISFGFGET